MNATPPAPASAATAPPAAVPPIWTTGSTAVFKTGTWRAALPHHIQAPSPCHHACPVHGEIAGWIGRARARDWRGAWDLLTRHNPFPAIAGQICHHPCESACNRAGFDEALAIRHLERFVGDQAIAAGWRFAAPDAERAGRIAVIGGGPAGLSAAYHLRRRGWRVTVFEASAEPGGLMRHGIPAYRLAREVLDAEIRRIVELGIELRCSEAVNSPEAFERLRASHDAVFVAVGAASAKRLPALDYTAAWAMDGAAYLAAANAGRAPALGQAVVVVGGGSAALDAARSAHRTGHQVTVLALEARLQMPAQREEVEEALEEGIALVDSAMLRRVETTADGLRLHCTRVHLRSGAERGPFEVEPIVGSDFTLAADAVLSSIGQDPDLSPFGGPLAASGALLAVDGAGATALPGVWAGGDVASMARHVTEAIAMGERAALAIHRQLGGGGEAEPPAALPTVALDMIATWYHPPAARTIAAKRPPSERGQDALEVQLGLGIEQALAECERCFSCGTCIACDNCIVVCPDLAVRRATGAGAEERYEVLGDYCKGCGLCVCECPTGSMAMAEEAR